MRVIRQLIPWLAGCAVLAGCGSSHSTEPAHTPGTVAMVGNEAISQLQIQQYMNYAMRFYSWVDTSASNDGTNSCSVHSATPACTTLRRQVLHRLIEERVVADYAARHGIRLSARDSKRVERELKRLQAPSSGTRRLFSAERVSPHFMVSVLRNQLLVKRVEAAVVGQDALTGPSFRMRKYVFGNDRQSYKNAIDLATGGATVASTGTPPIHWVAAYRLPARVRSLADVAGNGDYVGPSLQDGSYIVYQILERGVHRYGLPAREQIEARNFRTWLAKSVAKIQPICLRGPLKSIPCTTLYH